MHQLVWTNLPFDIFVSFEGVPIDRPGGRGRGRVSSLIDGSAVRRLYNQVIWHSLFMVTKGLAAFGYGSPMA